jgi:hypothetical protein
MKAFLILFSLALSVIQAAPIDQITTLHGKIYRQCEVVRVHPDGVSFTHANGAAKILFTDLPETWRTRFGYDPAKAAAYECVINERRQQIAAERSRRDAELSRAMAEAARMARNRQLSLDAQADAERQAIAKSPIIPAYPILPALGAVYDSRGYYPQFHQRFGFPLGSGGYGQSLMNTMPVTFAGSYLRVFYRSAHGSPGYCTSFAR